MSAPDPQLPLDPGLDPDDEIELAGLIETLRGATPPREVLAPARARVVRAARAPRAPTSWQVAAMQSAAMIAMVVALGAVAGGGRLRDPIARHDELARSTPAPARAPARAMEAAGAPMAAEGPAVASVSPPPASALPIVDARAPRDPHRPASAIVDRAAAAEPIAAVTDGAPVARFVEASGTFPAIDEDRPSADVESGASLTQQVPMPTTSVAPAEPSPLLAGALRDAAENRCEQAAIALQRVAEGESVDAPERVQHAELALARCLLRMGYVNAAFSVLDAITRAGPAHARFVEALGPLSEVGERMPDPRAVIEAVGRYSDEDLARAPAERRAVLTYFLGRARYDAADFEAAARLFASVPAGTRWYVPARYLEGVTHVRRHRARPAVAAFEAVLAAVGTDRDGGIGDRGRYRDLAQLAIARVEYTAASPGRAGADPARQQRLLEDALAAWQRVPFGSEAGLDAFFEESWALYVLGEHARALGHVHGLLAPQLRDRPHPEALVLRATIYYEHCRYQAAEGTVADFHRRFDALLTAIDARERAVADTDAAFRLLDDVRSGRAPSGDEGRVLTSAFDDREIARMLVQVRAIDAEIARIRGASAVLRESTLGLRIEQELAMTRALAVETAGEAVRTRLRCIADELRDRANEIDTVQLEVDTRRREAITAGTPLTTEPERPAPIVAVQGDQIWPFDGEYWEDELPYYREHVTSLCPR